MRSRIQAEVPRCTWATNERLVRYHDNEWGKPCHDDRTLFEFLILEGAQAGLSWDIILQKRERYRAVFAGFDPNRVARFSDAKLDKILLDPGIIRNRIKVYGTVRNARAFLNVQNEFGSFDAFIWTFSDAAMMSKELKKRGFTFVGPTICYAFMQAVGIVNDHLSNCAFRASPSRKEQSGAR